MTSTRSTTDHRAVRLTEFPRIFPPRPAGAIPPATVDRYAGYWGQFKLNDIRVMVEIAPGGGIEILSRLRAPVLSYSPSPELVESLGALDLDRERRHLLDGGITRFKVRGTGRPVLVIWDILVHDDHYLIGSSYGKRYRALRKIAGSPRVCERETGLRTGFACGSDLWLSRTFTRDFAAHFTSAAADDRIEGLMLKEPRGTLEWGASIENNGRWQVRVRKTSGRHIF